MGGIFAWQPVRCSHCRRVLRESDDYCPSCLTPRAGMAVFMLGGVVFRFLGPWILALAAAIILWKGERLRRDMNEELLFMQSAEQGNLERKLFWEQHQGQSHDDSIQKWINTPTR